MATLSRSFLILAVVVLAGAGHVKAGKINAGPGIPVQTTQAAGDATGAADRALIEKYCVTCHNERLRTGGLALETLDLTQVAGHADVWEKVVRKVKAGQMPPAGRPRPDAKEAAAFTVLTRRQARSRRRDVAQPGPSDHPSSEPHGIRQQHSRPAGARD